MKMDISKIKSINDKLFEAPQPNRVATIEKNEYGVSLSLTLDIPYNEQMPGDVTYIGEGFYADVIGAWSSHIITALEKRLMDCQKGLINNISNVVYNNGVIIMYKENNVIRNFNVLTFETIIPSAIKALKNDVWEFTKNAAYAEQAIKALMNYYFPVEKIDCFNVEDLISALWHVRYSAVNSL